VHSNNTSSSTTNISNNNNNNSGNDYGTPQHVEMSVVEPKTTNQYSSLDSSNSNKERSSDYIGYVASIPLNQISSDDSSSWEIEHKDLTMERTIGSGAYGAVYAGTWRGAKVAIKVMKSLTSDQLKSFQFEFDTMKNLRPHANCIRLFGICREPFSIITELMENGSLADLIQKKDLSESLANKISLGIAKGMVHLHYENIVHRDLAARNVLLTGDFEPKISDFGLSRFLSDGDSNKTESVVGPLKWMAPESISERVYSNASDVWSFGVVLVEIYTQDIPYPELEPLVVATKVISKSIVFPISKMKCSPLIVQIAKDCFNYDAKLRPTFQEIVKRLQSMQ